MTREANCCGTPFHFVLDCFVLYGLTIFFLVPQFIDVWA